MVLNECVVLTLLHTMRSSVVIHVVYERFVSFGINFQIHRYVQFHHRMEWIHYWLLHTVFILRFSIERDCALCMCVYAHMACVGQTFAFITSTLQTVEKKFQLDTRKKHKYTNWIDWGNPRNRKYCASCVVCYNIYLFHLLLMRSHEHSDNYYNEKLHVHMRRKILVTIYSVNE